MINWNHIDTVLLDMDGTLLDLHFDNYFWLNYLPEKYAEAHHIDSTSANALLSSHINELRGTLKWYCLDHWSELLSLDIQALKQDVKHKIRLRPFALEFLQQLRILNKRLVLVTNAHPDGLALKLKETEIDAWLDNIISSHEFQVPKEELSFWKQLQITEPFDRHKTLFIDDTLPILACAKTFGIKHLLCIRQPDSQREQRNIKEFPAIHHFDEILPSTR